MSNYVNNSVSHNESGYNESGYTDSDTESGDSINSDDDEYFIRFDSITNYDNVEYVMIGSNCYKCPDGNTSSSNQDSNEEDNECLECNHYVIISSINGYIDQLMIDKNEINNICRLQGIDISSHDIFTHLLE